MQHNPFFCIIPPYILENIARNGSPEQQAMAQQALIDSAAIREIRQAAAASQTPAPAAPAAVGGQKQRLVYTANNTTTLPGTLVRSEGQAPVSDVAVNEAYDGAGFTYDLYWNFYQRNSINNLGMTIISTVHYDRNYENAFWNGQQMVYGDGDEALPPAQQLFNRFTIALDVIGHELTHGVTQYSANMQYYGQPGALNESWSDVFGVLVKQYHLGQDARSANWIIGEGLFTPNVHGVGIRSMKAPGTAYDDPVLGKDPQPGNMSGYVNTSQDSGGVHINSGIPNHAFYIAAYEMGGNAWEKAGRIWYVALTGGSMNTTTTFQQAANITYQVAGNLYGTNSLEQKAVQKGWTDVGLPVGSDKPDCLTQLLRLFK